MELVNCAGGEFSTRWNEICAEYEWNPQDANFAAQRAYQLTQAEVDVFGHAMGAVNAAVESTIAAVLQDEDALTRMAIPAWVRPHLRASWQRRQVDAWPLLLRADFSLVEGVPVLLDWNGDCQGDLLEASYKQATFAELFKARQQNEVTDALLSALKTLKGQTLHVAVEKEGCESITGEVVGELAELTGVEVKRLTLEELSWDGTHFYDAENIRITTLYMVYPWECALNDEFGPHLAAGKACRVIEPLWKYVTSSKGFLVEMYRLNPGHPNLLPTFYEEAAEQLGTTYVRKPIFGWCSGNVQVVKGGQVVEEVAGPFHQGNPVGGAGRYIRQAYAPVPSFTLEGENFRPMFGVFCVGFAPQTLVIREVSGRDLTEEGEETVVPHIIHG